MVNQIRGPRRKNGFVMYPRDTDLPGTGESGLGPTVRGTIGLAREARRAAASTEDPEGKQELQKKAEVLRSLASRAAAGEGIDPHTLEHTFNQIRNIEQDGQGTAAGAKEVNTLKSAIVWGYMRK